MTSRRMSIAGLLTGAALALSACGGSGADTTTTDTSSTSTSSTSEASASESAGTTTSTTETPTEESTASASDGDAEGGDAPAGLTDPGTELAIGKTATLPQGKDDATVTVAVTKITKGSSADLAKLKDASKYAEYTPVYVQYEMTGTDSSSELGGDLLDDVDPILANGSKASTLAIIGTSPFTKCDRNSIPEDFAPGDTETTCQVAMVRSGQEVTGAQYAPYEGDYSDDGAVVWTS
ncbi:hypothetical protein ASG73_17055 [Janibacter sp. Soil728]|uniref:hypothetical protein n=1 Tax=Janibacter sp. Soil728 TaxID=1736393 RepID=UPI0007163551|nr:hypothetical protein [Janibacter sp. Soil728]KRE35050.1 hypothetical protein ASG73_17055 [Janibacter sp. Soil728]